MTVLDRGLWLLARSTSPVDRTRQRLLVAAVAAAGTLLIVALRLARLPGDSVLRDLAPFVAEPALRAGVVAGTALLVLPVALLGFQAVALGSAARTRWLAALRLAGATPGQRRTVAAIRTGRAGLLGGALAGPGYLGLWLLLGSLPGPEFRLLPPPTVPDLLVWAGVVTLGGLAGMLTGALTAGGGRASRPARRPGTRRRAVGLLVLAAVVFALLPVSVLVAALVLVVGIAVDPWRPALVALVARRLRRRGTVAGVLAAARLTADPGPPGRAAAVLALCGLAIGIPGGVVASVIERDDAGFYLAGAGIVGAAAAVAVLVVVLALVVAAADQIVDARRSVAALFALGADPALHRAVLRRQLGALSLPAAVAGAAVGSVAFGAVAVVNGGPAALAVLVAPVLVTAVLVVGVVRLAVAAAGGPLRAAADPGNLRTG